MKIKFNKIDQKILNFLCEENGTKLHDFYQSDSDIVINQILDSDSNGVLLWNDLTELTFDNATRNKTAFNKLLSEYSIQFLTSNNLVMTTNSWSCNEEDFSDSTVPAKKCVCPECSELISTHPSLSQQLSVDDQIIKKITLLNEYFISNFIPGKSLTNLNYMREHSDQLVPFLGSGISIPFKIPTWLELVNSFNEKLPFPSGEAELKIKTSFEQSYEKHDVFQMLKILEDNSDIVDNTEIFNEEVAQRINDAQQITLQENVLPQNNITDIISLNCRLIITTNYDTLLEHYSNLLQAEYTSMSWSNYTSNNLSNYSILHIHGITTSPKDIVFSQKAYKELYSSKKTNLERLSNAFGNKIHFFIGFSLNDQYVMNEFKHVLQVNNGFMANFYIDFSNSNTALKLPVPLKSKIKAIKVVYTESELQLFLKEKIDEYVFGIHIICMYLNNDLCITR